MHEDPTRRMDMPPSRGGGGAGGYGQKPPRSGMSGRIKALIAILVAAVIGLGVALAVVSADSGNDETTSASSVSSLSTVPSSTSITTTTPTTTTTSSSTTGATTTTTTESTTTTTDLGTITEGSGGTEAP